MKILGLRILPPIAIGRLGASKTPLAAYELQVDETKPLDFRRIVPQETLTIEYGILSGTTPDSIQFKDAHSIYDKDGKIRPVAPFLEVFAITEEAPDQLVPLTPALLTAAGLYNADFFWWEVEVANIKVFRRTGDENDKITASVQHINNSYTVYPLEGKCNNFREGKSLPLGTVQFVGGQDNYPGFRLRFTPGAGKVYGSDTRRKESAHAEPTPDPIINEDSLVLYDKGKGKWHGYMETGAANPTYTNPAQIFAGYNDDAGNRYSWGYLDDECDGFVRFHLNTGEEILTASAHISAGPPAFAPDTLPVRVVSDELEQILLGPDVDENEEVSIDEAEEIIRRAFETVRLMNTAVMNGNPLQGRWNVASTMVRQNTNDFGRYYEPIMAPSLVDNLALCALHERVFNGLSTGGAPWFEQVLRRPEEIGDLSAKGLRKMPALMRGADGRSLTMTRRQINKVIKAAASAMFKNAADSVTQQQDKVNLNTDTTGKTFIDAKNLAAQLHYRGTGNPMSVLPRTAISNCFPGLEFDFRNLWRRAFAGITLMENNNYVVATEESHTSLLHQRLVAIEGKPTMVETFGPTFPDASEDDSVTLQTGANPNAVSFMEWSNSMAFVLQKQGQTVRCIFTNEKGKDGALTEVLFTEEDLKNHPGKYQEVELKVNQIFVDKTATISPEVIKPGELTQGLCAPWQNDYRECACYYWAASRPDYVNVVPNENGLSSGDIWMAKKRTGEYIPDNRTDSRLLSYDDLFKNWQGELSFIIKGFDALEG